MVSNFRSDLTEGRSTYRCRNLLVCFSLTFLRYFSYSVGDILDNAVLILWMSCMNLGSLTSSICHTSSGLTISGTR